MSFIKKKRIAFVWSPIDTPEKMNLDLLYDDNRGVGGHEHSTMLYAKWLSNYNHKVDFFTNCESKLFDGVNFINNNSWNEARNGYDVVISCRSNDIPLVGITNRNTRKILFCDRNTDGSINADYHICEFREVHEKLTKTGHKSIIVKPSHNESVSSCEKTNTVIWVQKQITGVHKLISVWTDVKKLVPNSDLKIYNSIDWINKYYKYDHVEHGINSMNDLMLCEYGCRARYTADSYNKIKSGYDVKMFGHVSKNIIRSAMMTSKVIVSIDDDFNDMTGDRLSVSESLSHGVNCVRVSGLSDCNSSYSTIANDIAVSLKRENKPMIVNHIRDNIAKLNNFIMMI